MARKSTNQTVAAAKKATESRTKFLQTNPNAVNYTLRLDSINTMKEAISIAVTIAEMDKNKLSRRTKAAMKSEYGKVPGLINLLSAIINWPTDSQTPDNLSAIQDEICTNLGLEQVMLDDLREAKGFHTFLTEDQEIMDGSEPDYEEYNMLCELMASKLNLSVVDMKLSESEWNKREAKAIAKAKQDLEDIETELAEYRAANGL